MIDYICTLTSDKKMIVIDNSTHPLFKKTWFVAVASTLLIAFLFVNC